MNFAIGKHALIGATISIALTAGVKAEALPGVEFLRADQTITDFGGTPVKNQILSGSPILDADGMPLQGNLDVIFKLNPAATNDYVVSGTPVSPGEAVTVQHDFSATSGKLELPVHVSGAGSVSTDDYELTIINPGVVVWTISQSNDGYKDVWATEDDKILVSHGSVTNSWALFSSTGELLSSQWSRYGRPLGFRSNGDIAFYNSSYDTETLSWYTPGSTTPNGGFGMDISPLVNKVSIVDDVVHLWGWENVQVDLATGAPTKHEPASTVSRMCGNSRAAWPAFMANVNNCGWLDIYGESGVTTYKDTNQSSDRWNDLMEGLLTKSMLVGTDGTVYTHSGLPGFDGASTTLWDAPVGSSNFIPSGDAIIKDDILYWSSDNLLYVVPITNPGAATVTIKPICKNGNNFDVDKIHPTHKWAMGRCGARRVVAVNLASPNVYKPHSGTISLAPAPVESSSTAASYAVPSTGAPLPTTSGTVVNMSNDTLTHIFELL